MQSTLLCFQCSLGAGWRSTWGKGILLPLPHVKLRSAQWNYLDLCHQNCWHKSGTASCKAVMPGKEVRIQWRPVSSPFCPPSPCYTTSLPTHPNRVLISASGHGSRCSAGRQVQPFELVQVALEKSQMCFMTGLQHSRSTRIPKQSIKIALLVTFAHKLRA